MTSTTPIEPTDLPDTIRSYLAAHAAGDVDRAIRAFSPEAVVIDEQRTYSGIDEVLAFLRNAGSQFTYTTQLVGAGRLDDQHWVAVNHLEGDFPGGTVDLTYRFTIHGDRITELVIAPSKHPHPVTNKETLS